MFSANVFRPLPPPLHKLTRSPYDPQDINEKEEEEEAKEPAWPHLELVYEIFLRFLSLMNIKTVFLKKHISHAFVLNLLAVFDTEDRRERDCAKLILHKIYTKLIKLRVFIRKQMIFTFQR
ncbi:unnamed protein product [Mesocestoides corti]|uniref:Protein SDA1 n=1 Tax=Mesocestoides corti TaxID=53468 RepID=A0A158QVM8_MESCO|nr:unnamed protein product [Mesocestoides corti]